MNKLHTLWVLHVTLLFNIFDLFAYLCSTSVLFYRCPLACCHFCREPWSGTQHKELLHLNFSIILSFVAHPILHLLRTWWKVFDTVFVNLTVLLFGDFEHQGKNFSCLGPSFGFGLQNSPKQAVELKVFWSRSNLKEFKPTTHFPPWSPTIGFVAFYPLLSNSSCLPCRL